METKSSDVMLQKAAVILIAHTQDEKMLAELERAAKNLYRGENLREARRDIMAAEGSYKVLKSLQEQYGRERI